MTSLNKRISLDELYLAVLPFFGLRSTCRRRQVSAIITDQRGRVLSIGHNGVPTEMRHCTDYPCPGALDESGDNRHCEAVHAEQNAILQCKDPDRAHNIYVSVMPCFDCAKLISNTGIKRVLVLEDYADRRGKDFLMKRKMWIHIRNTGETFEHFTWIAPRIPSGQVGPTWPATESK